MFGNKLIAENRRALLYLELRDKLLSRSYIFLKTGSLLMLSNSLPKHSHLTTTLLARQSVNTTKIIISTGPFKAHFKVSGPTITPCFFCEAAII